MFKRDGSPFSDRLWWPYDYMDEVMPEGRVSPDAWLCRLSDGAHAYGIPGDPEPHYHPRALAEGDVIAFMWGETVGRAVPTFGEDGSFNCTSLPTDDVYIHVAGDPENGADTLEYLVECMRENGDDEGEYHLVANRSSGEISFRFTTQGGPPRFIAATEPPTDAETAEV